MGSTKEHGNRQPSMSLEVLWALFDSSPNAYRVVDRNLRYLGANHAYCRLTATKVEHLLGQSIFGLFPNDPHNPEDPWMRRVRESIERVFSTGQTDVLASYDYRAPTHTEHGVQVQQRVFSVSHSPLFDRRGDITAVLGHVVELTPLARGDTALPEVESRLLERARQVSEVVTLLRVEAEQLKTLFEQAPGFVAVLRGPEHLFSLANAAYLELIGRRDVIGKPVREALPEVQSQGFIELLDRTYASAQPFVGRGIPARLERRPGRFEERVVDFTFQPIVEHGAVAGIFVIGNDVTESTSAQHERDRLALERESLLQREEAALAEARTSHHERALLADFVPTQVWTADQRGLLTDVNQRVLSYFGTTRAEILGDRWLRFVHRDDRAATIEKWKRSLDEGTPYEVQFRLLGGTPREHRWHLARAVPVRDETGVVRKWFGTNSDVDEMKAHQLSMELLIRKLEHKNRELDRFAYVASHDLKAPLRAISNVSSFIAEDLGASASPEVLANLKALEGRAKRMQQLIDGILSYSRALEGEEKLEVLEPSLVAAEVVSLLTPPQGVMVTVEPHLPKVLASRSGLMQVLLNLIGNALKFVPTPGGVITVTGVPVATGVRIDVKDNGPGVAKEHHQRIFELFQTLGGPGEGTGIGLSVVRRIIESQGGQVGVESQQGPGARFWFTVPRAPNPEPNALESPPRPSS